MCKESRQYNKIHVKGKTYDRPAKSLEGIRVLSEDYKWHSKVKIEVNYLCELSNESDELQRFSINVVQMYNCIIIIVCTYSLQIAPPLLTPP